MRLLTPEISVSFFNALIVFCVYAVTAYPGLSFWDSGEWMVSCYSLQIPHAPGAPLYSLLGRIFAMAGTQNPDAILFRINLLSVVAGSLSVFFFSRVVYALAEFLITRANHFQNRIPAQLAAVCALLGGLMFGFSDTFWRNATEAEVYTLSACLFLSGILFAWKYATLGNSRYFFLSCFLAGSGLCVHPTNILLIPLLSALWVYRWILYQKPNLLITLLIWVLVNLILGFGLMKGLPGLAVYLDVLLAGESGLELPPGVGIALAWLFPIILLVFVASLFQQWRLPLQSAALLLFGLIFYALIPLRSDAPMNLGKGPDAAGFYAYYTREDFGSAPLLLGFAYNDKSYPDAQSKWVWNDSKNEYYLYPPNTENSKEGSRKFLPRMHSKVHQNAYDDWRKSNGYNVKQVPALQEEIRFLISEQMGKYFLKYLGWNLIGRRNDRYDSPTLGFTSSFTSERGQMPLCFLPFCLLLLGSAVIVLFSRVVFTFWFIGFLLTGPALVFMLNIAPEQVRERDYVFQFCLAFCFLMAAMAPIALTMLIPYAQRTLLKWILSLTLIVPLIQFGSAFASHQKSGNRVALDFATILLESCHKNSVLITAGDNDTFPLWCAQEILGIRKDVSILNLNLLHQPWYYRRLESPDSIGHFQLSTSLPDSLDYNPVLDVMGEEMERFKSLLLSKNWQAPSVWLRYEYLLSSILADIEVSQKPQVVVFSPLCQERDLLNLKSIARLDGIGRFLYFNTNPGDPRSGAWNYIRICRNTAPWNPDLLNYTERSFHKLIRKKGLLHAQSQHQSNQVLAYLKWLDSYAPADKKAGTIAQNLLFAAILDSCGNPQDAYSLLADLALQSAQNAHSEYSHELNCQEIREIESLLQARNPFFHFEENWFPEKHPHPCAGK